MALFDHREERLDTFILQLRRRFSLEPVSSLDGVPWQALERLRSQMIGDCCHCEQQAAGKAPLVDSQPRFGRYFHSFALSFGVRENTEARGLPYSLL